MISVGGNEFLIYVSKKIKCLMQKDKMVDVIHVKMICYVFLFHFFKYMYIVLKI